MSTVSYLKLQYAKARNQTLWRGDAKFPVLVSFMFLDLEVDLQISPIKKKGKKKQNWWPIKFYRHLFADSAGSTPLSKACMLKVYSYYAAVVLCCRTAPSCTEIVMLLHWGVAWKLYSLELEMQWSCGNLWQKEIDISAPQRNCSVVWMDLKAFVNSTSIWSMLTRSQMHDTCIKCKTWNAFLLFRLLEFSDAPMIMYTARLFVTNQCKTP